MAADPLAPVLAVRDALVATTPVDELAGATVRAVLSARAGDPPGSTTDSLAAAVPSDLDLGAAYERLLGGDRAARGTFYTPPWLVEHLLDVALDPVLDRAGDDVAQVLALRVCDPTCGSGRFLVAVVRRVGARLRTLGLPAPLTAAAGCVVGVDVDPVAADLARAAVRDVAGVPARVLVTDALGALPGLDGACDVVVGNPPFRNRLRAGRRDEVPAQVGGVALAAYTDLSAALLLRGVGLLAPDGRLALVQPRSVLSARDAGPVRRAVTDRAVLLGLWAGSRPVFPGTPVLTCAPVLRRGGAGGPVTVVEDDAPAREVLVDDTRLERGWGVLLAEHPDAAPGSADRTRLGEQARVTADFRDQYYGLVGRLAEGAPSVTTPGLLTSGTIDPAHAAWGTRPTRFARQDWQRPVVPLAGLEGPMARWAAARAVPKVLVATQGRVVEALVDADGTWLPGVPVLSVLPAPERLWHVLAALLSPVVTAHAAGEYAGSALAVGAIKLSARQLGEVPLPDEGRHWDAAADLVRRAQHATGAEERADLLVEAAVRTTAAYGADPALVAWWAARAERCVPGAGRAVSALEALGALGTLGGPGDLRRRG